MGPAPLVVLAATLLSACVALPTRDSLSSLPGPQANLVGDAAMSDARARFRDIFCALLSRDSATPVPAGCDGWLWRLDDEPAATHRPLPDADLAPQVYLVTGAFSECLGDEARPFNTAAARLRSRGYRIATVVVSGRSGPAFNARQIAERLADPPAGEEGPAVLVGYSKGINDILEFLVDFPQAAARVESVVSVAGAVGGSPLASQMAGIYDALLEGIPSSRCPPGDGQVIDSLGSETRRDWLESHDLPHSVRYYSIVAFTTSERVARILRPAWKLLIAYDSRNDGQLLARDALIPGSTLLGYVDADHWSVAIDVESVHPVLGARHDTRPFPREALLEAILLKLAEDRVPD